VTNPEFQLDDLAFALALLKEDAKIVVERADQLKSDLERFRSDLKARDAKVDAQGSHELS